MFRLLTFLGTSSGTPTPYRNVSSACLSLADGRVWMFDCGEGTQHQLLKCKDVSVSRIEKVFLTHLHGDHCYGLPGMLCSMSLLWSAPGVVPNATYAVKKRDGKAAASSEEEEGGNDDGNFVFDHFSKTSEFLEIYGPFGTATFLREVLRSSETRFGFKYRVTEFLWHGAGVNGSKDNKVAQSRSESAVLAERSAGSVEVSAHTVAAGDSFIECEAPTRRFDALPSSLSTEVSLFDGYHFHLPAAVLDPLGGVAMKCAWLDHPVPSLGYALQEPTVAGTMDMAKATALRIPKGPLLAKLKKGESISFPDPTDPTKSVTVASSDVIGPPIAGRKLTMLGDTCGSDRMLLHKGSSSPSSSSTSASTSIDFIGIAENSDWMSHESTFDDGNSALAVPRGHSTARMAGAFARSAHVKKLIITHFSARYPPEEKDPQPIANLKQQAVEGLCGIESTVSEADGTAAAATSSVASRSDDVIAAYDFLSIDLSRAAGGSLLKKQ